MKPLYYTDGELSRTLVDEDDELPFKVPSSLEEALQAFVIAIEGEREALWEAGDILAGIPKAALGHFASAAKCTRARVGQLAEVARSFEPGLRDRERSWTWHRAARSAALRTERPLPEVLQEAQEKDYGQRELSAMGRNRGFVSWGGTCGVCGARMSVRLIGAGMKGHPVFCPMRCDGMDPMLGSLA